MYHIQNEAERIQAVKELNRVTKQDGIVFVAFMSRIRHIFSSLMAPESWKPNHHIVELNQFSQSGIFNHTDEGRFTGAYYFNIEDIQPFMESQGFKCWNSSGRMLVQCCLKKAGNIGGQLVNKTK